MSKLFSCFDCGNNLSHSASICPKCQTQRFEGVVCKACEKISKASECVSVLMSDRIPKEISEKGEVKHFNNDESYRYKWFRRSLGNEEYYCLLDGDKYQQKRLEKMDSEHEVFHFCEKCYHSIRTPVKKAIEVECFSCCNPFYIDLEKYMLGVENMSRACGSCGDSTNGRQFHDNNIRKCFNCHFPVLIDEGIKIFNFDGYLEKAEYVHKSCLNENISRKELEIEGSVRKQKIEAKQKIERQELEAKKKVEQQKIEVKQKAEQLAWQENKRLADQRREKIRLIRKILIILLSTSIAIVVLYPFIIKIAHSFHFLSMKKGELITSLLAAGIIVGLIPLLGELVFLIYLILLMFALFANSYDDSLATFFLIFVTSFLGISFRYVITGVFTKK